MVQREACNDIPVTVQIESGNQQRTVEIIDFGKKNQPRSGLGWQDGTKPQEGGCEVQDWQVYVFGQLTSEDKP